MHSKDTRTEEQREALIGLIRDLKARFPGVKVYGHKDFANKACPGFDAKLEYNEL